MEADPDLNGAGEFIWGAMVHAVSAADPEHEIHGQDRFGNRHEAPAAGSPFRNAVARINEPTLDRAQADWHLHVGQRKLHNDFYQSEMHPLELSHYVGAGRRQAERLISIARCKLRQASTP